MKRYEKLRIVSPYLRIRETNGNDLVHDLYSALRLANRSNSRGVAVFGIVQPETLRAADRVLYWITL
jgi:hypothetical protein